MELIVDEVKIPDRISCNYEDLKQELEAKLRVYETVVYTPETMRQAKADKAALNKLRKALNDERIRREREYMAPFTAFKAQIADLIACIDRPVALIDKQVKEYEEQKKSEKRKAITDLYLGELKGNFPTWLEFERIFDPRWLNASYSMKSIRDDLEQIAVRILSDIAVLSELPSFSFEAIEVYKRTLDLQSAVNEGKRMADVQARKEEAERRRAEAEAARAVEIAPEEIKPEIPAEVPAPDPAESVSDAGQWISFKARLTFKQAVSLREFFERNGIEFMAI